MSHSLWHIIRVSRTSLDRPFAVNQINSSNLIAINRTKAPVDSCNLEDLVGRPVHCHSKLRTEDIDRNRRKWWGKREQKMNDKSRIFLSRFYESRLIGGTIFIEIIRIKNIVSLLGCVFYILRKIRVSNLYLYVCYVNILEEYFLTQKSIKFLLFFKDKCIFYFVTNYQPSIERQFAFSRNSGELSIRKCTKTRGIFLTSRCSSVKVSPLVDRFFESVRLCLASRHFRWQTLSIYANEKIRSFTIWQTMRRERWSRETIRTAINSTCVQVRVRLVEFISWLKKVWYMCVYKVENFESIDAVD